MGRHRAGERVRRASAPCPHRQRARARKVRVRCASASPPPMVVRTDLRRDWHVGAKSMPRSCRLRLRVEAAVSPSAMPFGLLQPRPRDQGGAAHPPSPRTARHRSAPRHGSAVRHPARLATRRARTGRAAARSTARARHCGRQSRPGTIPQAHPHPSLPPSAPPHAAHRCAIRHRQDASRLPAARTARRQPPAGVSRSRRSSRADRQFRQTRLTTPAD